MLIAVLLVCLLVLGTFGLILYGNSIAVFNSCSYMAIAPEVLIRETDYLHQLPALLMRLRESGFAEPWPASATPFGTYRFRRKLIGSLAGVGHSSRLAEQHLGLWAFLREHQSDLERVIAQLKWSRARQVLARSPAADERDRALQFLNTGSRRSKRQTRPVNTPIESPWLAPLRAISTQFSEHGYELDQTLTTLFRLETADRRTFLSELVAS